MAALGTSAPGALGRGAPRSWGSDICGDLPLSLCRRTRGRGRQLGAGKHAGHLAAAAVWQVSGVRVVFRFFLLPWGSWMLCCLLGCTQGACGEGPDPPY